MSGAAGSLLTVCVVLVAIEALGRLCPKNSMVGFVRGLVAAVLLLSAVFSLSSFDWDLTPSENHVDAAQEELSGYVREQYQAAVQEESVRTVQGLLAAAGMRAEKIQIFTDITEDSRIVCTKVSVDFAHGSDAERARVLLANMLGEEIEIEVTTNGA